MDAGHYISGIGHGVLLAWALIGGLFSRVPEDTIRLSEVSIISAQEFEALRTPAPVPDVAEAIPALVQPEIEDTPPEPPVEDTPPDVPQPPIEEMPPPVEEPPEVTEITPPPEAEVEDTPPELPQPPAEDNPVVLAPPADIASPRPAPRVAPTPVEAPPEDTEIADEAHEDVTEPTEDAPQIEDDPEPETAPEETTEQIRTEADESPSSAPTASARPSQRPKRPEPPVETADAPSDPTIEETLRALQAESTAPTGPPITGGEKDAFLVDVRRCWNVGALSTAALETKVVVRFELAKDGKPNVGSIHMTGFEGGTEASAKQAYEAARRAIIRCGATGYNLPIEKFEQWKIINITFNPKDGRLR